MGSYKLRITRRDDAPAPDSASPPTNNNDNNNNNNNKSPSTSPTDDGNGKSPPPPDGDNTAQKSPPPPASGTKTPGVFAPPPPPSSTKKAISSPNTSGGSNDNSTLNTAAIIGVAAAGLVLIALLAICCACCVVKKKKKRNEPPMYYGGETSPRYKGNEQYYNNSAPPPGQGWNQPPPDYQNWQGPPPPGNGGWGPPPPPPMFSSGDQSSQFSGPHRPAIPPPSPNIALGFNKSTFTYDELAVATSGFSQANLLGQGGFGYVHKGVLHSGKTIAVKSLKSGSGQGEREFQAEVEIISRVHHRYLVSLVGYCIAGGQRMLVYEFVPNNTLEHHLHGKGLPVMEWSTRLKIALGSAKGLAYLHEDCHPRIIHRDIKSANILLDDNFEAMVADFGLAKLSTDNHTHVSTRVMGTFGYLAPEYAASGKLSEKSDVFSFGVMLLELLTGKRPVDPNNMMEDSLVDWARPLLSQAIEDGDFRELADPKMENIYNPQEMARMVSCAAAAIRHSARKRPKMSQIVRALEGDSSLDDLNEGGVKPGQSSVFSTQSVDYSQSTYNADLQKFRQMALGSQEFQSSEFAGSSSNNSETRDSK